MTEVLQSSLNILALGGSNQLLEDPESSPCDQRAAPQVNILSCSPEEKLFQSCQSVLLLVARTRDDKILDAT